MSEFNWETFPFSLIFSNISGPNREIVAPLSIKHLNLQLLELTSITGKENCWSV